MSDADSFDVTRHNDPTYKPPSPWTEWSTFANCWTCVDCGAAYGFQVHNPQCSAPVFIGEWSLTRRSVNSALTAALADGTSALIDADGDLYVNCAEGETYVPRRVLLALLEDARERGVL